MFTFKKIYAYNYNNMIYFLNYQITNFPVENVSYNNNNKNKNN